MVGAQKADREVVPVREIRGAMPQQARWHAQRERSVEIWRLLSSITGLCHFGFSCCLCLLSLLYRFSFRVYGNGDREDAVVYCVATCSSLYAGCGRLHGWYTWCVCPCNTFLVLFPIFFPLSRSSLVPLAFLAFPPAFLSGSFLSPFWFRFVLFLVVLTGLFASVLLCLYLAFCDFLLSFLFFQNANSTLFHHHFFLFLFSSSLCPMLRFIDLLAFS